MNHQNTDGLYEMIHAGATALKGANARIEELIAEVERLQAENTRLKTGTVCQVCVDLGWDGCECCYTGIRNRGPDGLLL